MLSVRTRVRTDKDAAGAVSRGTERALLDAAGAGFRTMSERIASEATDTGQLLKSGIPPQVESDGSVITGFSAEYARYVDKGTRPHWPPIQPLIGWARRVLGDEQAAWAVQRKIAREGTEGIHFARDGISAITATLRSRGIGGYISEELR